ncbi:hypothetical protein BDW22DRAFT_1362709 [Trametopsis cervina]|nr:hypothetical protein BDW22DRAFT_1362709 [Trametopsis cervina]
MKVVIASRTVSIFADALVLALTCIKTLSVSRGMRALQMQHSSISQLLVRKGFLYFLVFLLLNIIQTIIQETTGIEYLSPYIVAITSVLTSRFLLNLRQNNESSEAEPVISDIVFRRHSLNQFATTFVANFGEDLNFVEQIAPPV